MSIFSKQDVVEQITRIVIYAGSPLLVKWGVDDGNAAAILGGFGAFIGSLGWWLVWDRRRQSAPVVVAKAAEVVPIPVGHQVEAGVPLKDVTPPKQAELAPIMTP